MNQRLRVLFVEDDEALTRAFSLILPDADPRVTVEAAGTLADAVARLALGGVSVVLLDLSLPDVSGIETVRLLEAAHPEIPIVVLTGNVDAEGEALRAGAQEFLVKGDLDGGDVVRALRHAAIRHEVRRDFRAVKDPLAAALATAEKLEEKLSGKRT